MKKEFVLVMSVLWALLLLAASTSAQVEQPTPQPNTYVHDFAGVISDDKKNEIQAKAQRLKDEYKTEIAVVTIDSLQGEDSFDYSMRMARSWGIGSKDNDTRGLLIVVAVKDRKTAFRTSRHIEGEITDGTTGEINRQMNAYFKQSDFGGGLSFGMDKILERLHAAYEPQPVTVKPSEMSGLVWLILILTILVPCLSLIVFTFWAIRKKNREEQTASPGSRQTSSYDSGSSGYSSSSSNSNSGSSSSNDSGSSYSGGSDYGGSGSDSGW